MTILCIFSLVNNDSLDTMGINSWFGYEKENEINNTKKFLLHNKGYDFCHVHLSLDDTKYASQ